MSFPQPPFGSAIQGIVSGGATRVVAVWQNWIQLVQNYMSALTGSGPTSARPTKDLWVGQPFFDTTINVPVYWNGSTWVTSAPAGTVTAVTGTSPIASSGGTTPDISISQANATTNGYLSSTDWNTFNSKQPAGTYVNSVGAVSPVVSTGGTAPVISMPAASASTSGYLTSTDWNTFNNAVSYGAFVNVKAYGATGNGSTDDTTSIQNAINANQGRTIYFPAGIYIVNATLTVSNGNFFCGDGAAKSIIKTSSTTNDVFNVSTTNQCGFRDLGFQTSVTRLAGSYVIVDPSSGYNSGTYFFNVGMDHPYIGINFVDANIFLVNFCYFTSYAIAIQVANVASPDAGDSNITNSTFDAGAISSGVSINQVSSGGLKITANKFLHGAYHYLCQFNASTSIAVVTGNSFETASTALIALNSNSAQISNVDISGNQFSVQTTGSRGILCVGTNFNNIYIGGNEFNCAGNVTGIGFGGGTNITLGSNQYYDTGGGGTAIDFSVNNPSIYVLPQSINNFSSNFTNISSNQRFCVGQEQHGSGSYGGGYGPYGNVFIGGPINVTFAYTFPAPPTINVTLDNPGSGSAGAIGALVRNVSASGFTMYVITASSGGTIYYAWNGYTTGQ